MSDFTGSLLERNFASGYIITPVSTMLNLDKIWDLELIMEKGKTFGLLSEDKFNMHLRKT